MSTSFDAFYEGFWRERWALLRSALGQKELQVARWNKFAAVPAAGVPFSNELQGCTVFNDQLKAQIFNDNSPLRGAEDLLATYVMDPASVWIAKALQVQPGDDVLDLCAAPGGKSLVLIEALEKAGNLIANEPSPQRRDRLIKIIQQYVPRQVRERVRVTGQEGGLWATRHPKEFDRVLVDAPCSGERHLLRDAAAMKEWSARRSSRLAQEQYALLSGALIALRPGGVLMYSTCSLSPVENDEVIRRLLKKKSDLVEVDLITPEMGAEPTEFGVWFLPDRLGFGPLYACRLKKR